MMIKNFPKKILNIFLLGSILISKGCSKKDTISPPNKLSLSTSKTYLDLVKNYVSYIEIVNTREYLNTLASDEFQGRETGSLGEKKATEYIAEQFKKLGLKYPPGFSSYFQEVPFREDDFIVPRNVIAYLEGVDPALKEEVLVISAHHDHLGIRGDRNNMSRLDDIHNGADDNASGVSALLEIAEAFSKAKENGDGPKRSILFITFTAEEHGLIGSKWYVEHPIFPLNKTIANLNMDMLGRVDDAHQGHPEYCYLIASKMLSTDLPTISEEANTLHPQLKLDYQIEVNYPEDNYHCNSDHYSFLKNKIPVIYYSSGSHPDYHTNKDEIDKIAFPILVKRAQLIFSTAVILTNREQRPKIDVSTPIPSCVF